MWLPLTGEIELSDRKEPFLQQIKCDAYLKLALLMEAKSTGQELSFQLERNRKSK